VVYYVDRGGLLHRSADRGEHWTAPSPASIGYAQRLIAHPGDPNTFYVATSSGLWCSADGGASWLHNPGMSSLLDGDILDAAIDPDTPAILYAAQRSGLKKSYDAGGSWTTVVMEPGLPLREARPPRKSAVKAPTRPGPSPSGSTQELISAKGGRDVALRRRAMDVRGTGRRHRIRRLVPCDRVDPFDDNVILSAPSSLDTGQRAQLDARDRYYRRTKTSTGSCSTRPGGRGRGE
jgi:hypothetical protein